MFDGSNPASAHPTYGDLLRLRGADAQRGDAREPVDGLVLLVALAGLPLHRGRRPLRLLPGRDQLRRAEPAGEPGVGQQRPLPDALRADRQRRGAPTYQLLVANLYRLFFWKLIGSLQQTNWMCDRVPRRACGSRARRSSSPRPRPRRANAGRGRDDVRAPWRPDGDVDRVVPGAVKAGRQRRGSPRSSLQRLLLEVPHAQRRPSRR